MKESNTRLIGDSGKYFVAAELLRRGYIITSLYLEETEGVHILCSDIYTNKDIKIIVKTRSNSTRSWVLDKKDENYFADNLFYILVTLNNKKPPDFFIVPSKVVADYVKMDHANWLKTPGVKGQKHQDNHVRKFNDREGKYLNRWDLLNL